MNVDRDICLPCGNTCNDVSPVQPRRRRISAPNMLNDIQKEQLHFMGRRGTRVAVLRLPQPMMAEGHLTISATIREVDGSSSEEESTSARRRRHRDAIVFSVDGAVASAAKQVRMELATLMDFVHLLTHVKLLECGLGSLRPVRCSAQYDGSFLTLAFFPHIDLNFRIY